jgi:1-acyl-sn-glycerol-3-phosphate acyltransferase
VKASEDHPSPVLYEICRFIGLCISKVFWRIEFKGTENIPHNSTGGLLVVANHQTYVDPVWISLPVKRKFRYMAWDAAFEWFFVGNLMRRLGAFPIRTVGEGGKIDAMKKALKFLRGGSMLVIFPEGERCFADGKMLTFKPGALRIAMEAGVPVMPVTIRGGNEVWARGSKYPRFGKVEIIFHPPFEVKKPERKADLDECVENLNKRLVEIIGNSI